MAGPLSGARSAARSGHPSSPAAMSRRLVAGGVADAGRWVEGRGGNEKATKARRRQFQISEFRHSEGCWTSTPLSFPFPPKPPHNPKPPNGPVSRRRPCAAASSSASPSPSATAALPPPARVAPPTAPRCHPSSGEGERGASGHPRGRAAEPAEARRWRAPGSRAPEAAVH